jgi:hypothetical protein
MAIQGRKEFLKHVFTLYEIYRIKYRRHPVWLTKWSDFQSLWNLKTADKANQWCHWLGISTERKSGQWIAVLRFTPRHFTTGIYHPTVLEAGANVYHFPAPEGVAGGGLAADLEAGSKALATEYIAVWPPLTSASMDFHRGCAQLEPLKEGDLRSVRRHHHHRLQAKFHGVPSACEWLDRVGSF